MKKKIYTVFFIIIIIIISLFCMKSYLTHEYKIIYSGNFKKTDKPVFIIFHGIYGESKDLQYISNILNIKGYPVVNIQYPTTTYPIEEMTEKYITPVIEKQIKNLNILSSGLKPEEQKNLKVNFIVHSMGSALLRYYLKNHKIDTMGKVMFISPPSHGSPLSDNPISDSIPYFLGPAVSQIKTDKNSFINTLGEPDYQCYILIGDHSDNFLYSFIIPGKDDGMIPFSTARLQNCTMKVIINTTHTSILESKDTLREIENYFEIK